MRSIPIYSKALSLESGETCTLDYYITVDTMPEEEDVRLAFENYGVKIVFYRSGSPEEVTLRGITTSYNRICKLVILLSDNLVTPVSLPYIVSDWL